MRVTPMFALLLLAALSLVARTSAEPLCVDYTETRVLVLWYSISGWTQALANEVTIGAQQRDNVLVRNLNVSEAACDDLAWADGLALGSPVYFGGIAAPMKQFLDDIQLKCYGWPAAHTALQYKVGGAFATGGQIASGLDTVRQDLMTAMLSLSMTVLGGNTAFGAATWHPDNATAVQLPQSSIADARTLGFQLATVAAALAPLRPLR